MSLNDQQRAVVESTAQRILCLAGAGAGKTHTMIERIRKLVADGAKPDSILVLTFTNAAAMEMKVRYGTDATSTPEFRTFHSFCYNLICTDEVIRNKLGYRMVPNIIDDLQIKRIRASILAELSLKIPVKVLDGLQPPDIRQQSALKLYNTKLRNYLHQHGLITFDYLCYEVCKLFETGDSIIFPYTVKYKYIFVDEFQDTDPKQWRFVDSFKNANLFVVGDKKQAIYSFRGADSSIIQSLSENTDWSVYRLEHNYRSTQEICKFANKISKSTSEGSSFIEMKSDVPGGMVKQIEQNPERYIDDIVDILKSVKGSTAILARTNAEVNQLAHDLDNEHISFDVNTTDKHTEYVLRSIVDNGFCAEYLASLLDSEKYLQYIKNLYIDKPEDVVSYLITNYGEGYLKHTYDKIMRFRRDIEDKFKVKTPVQICKWLICQFCSSYDDVPICEDTVNSIVNAAIDELNKISKNNNDVYIGTIHSVKGLEYDNVIVVGVGGPNFRIKEEEMCNLFYVACTRAKFNLYLFIDDYGIPANLKWLFTSVLNSYLDYEDTY